ncbi:MAG: hypothetical protein KC736_00895 [Candidatus Moranbacteria bacterium]|nr:hypothetical protein [Candidatus Moranbacteria bacterium]
MPVSVAIEEFAKLLALFAAISSLRGKNLPLNNFLAALFFGVGFSLYELFLVMSSASILLAGVIFLLHFSTTVLLLSGLRRLSDHAIFPIFSLLVAFLVHWGYNTLAQSLLLSTVSGVIISLFLLFLSYRISSYGSRSS